MSPVIQNLPKNGLVARPGRSKTAEIVRPAHFEQTSWFGLSEPRFNKVRKDPHGTDKPHQTGKSFRDVSCERSARGVRAAASGHIIIRLAKDKDDSAAESGLRVPFPRRREETE
jgi:hypothetical protein